MIELTDLPLLKKLHSNDNDETYSIKCNKECPIIGGIILAAKNLNEFPEDDIKINPLTRTKILKILKRSKIDEMHFENFLFLFKTCKAQIGRARITTKLNINRVLDDFNDFKLFMKENKTENHKLKSLTIKTNKKGVQLQIKNESKILFLLNSFEIFISQFNLNDASTQEYFDKSRKVIYKSVNSDVQSTGVRLCTNIIMSYLNFYNLLGTTLKINSQRIDLIIKFIRVLSFYKKTPIHLEQIVRNSYIQPQTV